MRIFSYINLVTDNYMNFFIYKFSDNHIYQIHRFFLYTNYVYLDKHIYIFDLVIDNTFGYYLLLVYR